MGLKEHYKGNHSIFWEFYNVPDQMQNSDSIIFVLESGHKDEVIFKKPLSGQAGINFSQILLNNEIAVGQLPKSVVERMGFIESSPIPLDVKTYKCFFDNAGAPIKENDLKAVQVFTEIKKKYGEYSEQKLHNEFKDWLSGYLGESRLFEDYKARMNTVWNQDKYFIICGFVAQGFFEKFIGINGRAGFLKFYKKTGLAFCDHGRNKVIYFEHPSTWKVQGLRETQLKLLIDTIK